MREDREVRIRVSKDKIIATLAKPRRCIFPHFCAAVDLGEEKKSTTCSGESFIGALAKKMAVLVKRAKANMAISCVVHCWIDRERMQLSRLQRDSACLWSNQPMNIGVCNSAQLNLIGPQGVN